MKTLFKYLTIGILLLTLILLILFSVLWISNSGDYSVPKTTDNDPNLPAIELNHYRFHGETFGDPSHPVIIVVHGGPGWDYRSLLPLQALSDEYFIVFYDQRGSGLSPRVAADQLTLESSISDLNEIVDHFRSDQKVILIGHSWGAMLSTAYLGEFPLKVSSAILAEPGFLNTELFTQSGIHFGPRLELNYLWFATQKWFESRHINQQTALGEKDQDASMDYFLAKAASEANPEYYCDNSTPESGKLYWRAGSTAMGAILGSQMNQKGELQLDLTKGLDNFNEPVLLIASECNKLIGVEQQKRHQKFFNNSQLSVISNSGHMMFGEQPEQSLKVIRNFLEKDHLNTDD